MTSALYRRHRFPPEIIQHAIWLYLRLTPIYRIVEELLADRGLDISWETVRRWVLKFGPAIARRLRQRRPSDRWLWMRWWCASPARGRAVDHEGEVLDMLVQRRRDTRAALRLMRKLSKSKVWRRNCGSPTGEAPFTDDKGRSVRNEAPADHDSRDPQAGTNFVEDHVTGHLEQEIPKEERGPGAQAEGGLAQSQILPHRQCSEADIDPVDVKNEIEDAREGQDAPVNLAHRPLFDRLFPQLLPRTQP
jgi:DDE domain